MPRVMTRKKVIDSKEFLEKLKEFVKEREARRECRKIRREDIKKIRGNVIENALDVEQLLSIIIGCLFVKDTTSFYLFKQLILDKEFLIFSTNGEL